VASMRLLRETGRFRRHPHQRRPCAAKTAADLFPGTCDGPAMFVSAQSRSSPWLPDLPHSDTIL
jgi:hypothetical protein